MLFVDNAVAESSQSGLPTLTVIIAGVVVAIVVVAAMIVVVVVVFLKCRRRRLVKTRKFKLFVLNKGEI